MYDQNIKNFIEENASENVFKIFAILFVLIGYM